MILAHLQDRYTLMVITLKENNPVRKIWLTMKEEFRYEKVKKHVDAGGNFKRLCIELDVSKRTARRFIAGYKKEGKAFFVHGNRCRKPPTSMSEEDRALIVDTYKDPLYKDANFIHFHELLIRRHPEIPPISLSTLRNILKEADIISPKANRLTKANYNKRLKEKTKDTLVHQPEEVIIEELALDPDPHPRREKSRFAGELVFLDASEHDWLEVGYNIHLHAAIDDSTGEVLGAFFDYQETLFGYYMTLKMILDNYGIPFHFQTDGRTIFEYAAFSRPHMKEDTYTQFSYACKSLGIGLNTTPSAEAQGKVERLFQTLQSRLIVEMRLEKIKTIKEANEFLKKHLPKHNEKFATSHPHDTANVFEKKPTEEEINLTLAVLESRTIDNGNAIRFKNCYYRLINKESKQVNLRPKTKVLVIKALDGKLYCSAQERVFALEEIKPFKERSFNFDSEHVVKIERTYSIPDMHHPWRKERFEEHQKSVWQSHYRFDWDKTYSNTDLWYTTERLFD